MATPHAPRFSRRVGGDEASAPNGTSGSSGGRFPNSGASNGGSSSSGGRFPNSGGPNGTSGSSGGRFPNSGAPHGSGSSGGRFPNSGGSNGGSSSSGGRFPNSGAPGSASASTFSSPNQLGKPVVPGPDAFPVLGGKPAVKPAAAPVWVANQSTSAMLEKALVIPDAKPVKPPVSLSDERFAYATDSSDCSSDEEYLDEWRDPYANGEY